MDHQAIDAVFKPKASKIEAKADQTTRVARGIMAAEEASRNAKSARLKAARLIKEAADRELEASKPRPGPKTKKRAQRSSR